MIKRKFVHSIITLFIFLLFSFQIVFAGTHSTHYVTSWWVSEITGAIITLNKGQLITHLIFPQRYQVGKLLRQN